MNAAFQVGDRVMFSFGRGTAKGRIIEDLGPIGVGGRRLYRILRWSDPFEPEPYTLPEDKIKADDEPPGGADSIEMTRIIDYLKNAGLTSILHSNIADERYQPRVWLCLDSLGNVTHTFYKERGVVGGETVPFQALYDSHIFTPKQDEVLAFLRSFGLDDGQAADVIASVRTAPKKAVIGPGRRSR